MYLHLLRKPGIRSSSAARPSSTLRARKSGKESAKETVQIMVSVKMVRNGRQSWGWVGWMITEYRSKAMAVMLIVETKMEVACSAATNLHMSTPDDDGGM